MISSGATRRISDGATHHHRHGVDVHNDAFFELNQAELDQSVKETFTTDNSATSGSDDGASIITDLVLTPLNMLSLLLSLLLVDQQREEKKQKQLKQNRNWSDHVRWSKESEPYQAQRDATWQPDQSKKNFDWSAKHRSRKGNKAELTAALNMSRRVFIAVLLWSAIILLIFSLLVRQCCLWISKTSGSG